MIYNLVQADISLENIVKQYIIINSLEGMEKLIFLPNACNFIVFNNGLNAHSSSYNEDEKFTIPLGYSISVKTNKVSQIVIEEQENITFPIIMAELAPIGYFKLFNQDASVLNASYLEMDESIREEYFSNLYEHASLEDEIDYLNASLLALYKSHQHEHLKIQDILNAIYGAHYLEVSVDNLIEEFGCSRSTLERQFKRIIGFTPKNFIFIAKFCKTVVSYVEDKATYNDLMYIYSDSSHLNSVFKKFLSANPSEILQKVSEKTLVIHQMKK